MRAILLAARPKTLPAAIVPVWLGCCLAYQQKGEWSLSLMCCTLLSAICIQIATNLFNDAIDASKGADTANRLGPTRVTASGILTKQTVFKWAAFFLAIASIFALYLIYSRGWIILAIGIPSLYLSYGYTGGKFPLAYLGLGELFVFLFFGIIATMGTYYVQTEEWSPESALLGAIIGLLSCFLIAINNLRDVVEDTSTGKKTLCVRLGPSLYKRIMFMMAAHCSLAILGLWWWLSLPIGCEICFIIVNWILLNAVIMEKNTTKLNKYLALSGLSLLVFALMFTVSL